MTDQLHQQIARLNLMVDALLTANEALRKENEHLKKIIAGGDLIYSEARSNLGINEAKHSDAKSENAIPTPKDSDVDFSIGINQVKDSDAKSENTIPTPKDSDADFSIGINQAKHSDAKSSIGINEDSTLLPNYSINPQNASGLAAILRQNEKTGGVSAFGTYTRFAKIILQAYNGGDCSYKALKALTGLSKGGIAKALMSLRKRGLIVRQKGRVFIPTAYSKQLMMKAGLVNT